jgi:hypothetical protein
MNDNVVFYSNLLGGCVNYAIVILSPSEFFAGVCFTIGSIAFITALVFRPWRRLE